jgi:isopenicillin N synthase-like dioxygenase
VESHDVSVVDASLPVIDVSEFRRGTESGGAIAAAVERALSENGFMYVIGHGSERSTMMEAFDTARRFFGQPRAIKDRYSYRDVASNFGYQGIGEERLDPSKAPDLKEAFTMRNALGMAQRQERWPDDAFRESTLAFYVAASAAAHRLLQILALSLRLPGEFFRQRHRGENVTLRLLHYPANLTPHSNEQLGAGAHTDYGSITLLFQDEVGGLELSGPDGEWRTAPPIPDAIVINTGDLMERWTNGRFRSTVHRVQPITGNRNRYSMALFVDPDSDVEVSCIDSCATLDNPARYPMITAGEHLRQKIEATHRKQNQDGPRYPGNGR